MTQNKRPTLGKTIIEGLEEAIAFERGERPNTRVRRVLVTAREATVTPAPSYAGLDIVRLRERLELSQPVFAQVLNVKPETVKAWEQGKRRPDGAASRLLQLSSQYPDIILKTVKLHAATKVGPKLRVAESKVSGPRQKRA